MNGMTRLLAALAPLVLLAGCSVCCTPFDDAYPAYGGKWERTDRFEGRVGSRFHPASANEIEQVLVKPSTQLETSRLQADAGEPVGDESANVYYAEE